MAKHHKVTLIIAPALLLLMFLLRSYNITAQLPYADEGLHIVRGTYVWSFDQHPVSFAMGKVLTYYWLGLFESAPSTQIVTGRLAIAIIVLISGATIFQIGRMLHSSAAGLIALGIYAILPYTVFYERMALADPFAAVFANLLVWRSLVFARRPSLWQGVVLGLLIGLASLAKLTMGTTPLVAVAIAIILADWKKHTIQTCIKHYMPGFIWG